MIRLTLEDGGEGEAVTLEGVRLTAMFARAFAPGAPIPFTAALEPPLRLRGKSLGSKRGDDGRFTVRMRLISLRKEERAALEAALRTAT